MSFCHGPPAKCVIHSFVGVGFQKLLHLSEWIEWSRVLSFGSSGNLFFCCDIVYVPRVPPDSRSHTPFASYWPLGGVNWSISDPKLFKSGLIFLNLTCQLVEKLWHGLGSNSTVAPPTPWTVLGFYTFTVNFKSHRFSKKTKDFCPV